MNDFEPISNWESFEKDDEEKVLFVKRTTIFDRKLERLRRKGCPGSLAAKKVDDLINNILCGKIEGARQQFRLTRNGEFRIKHCMKYDLGCGYRLAFIRKGAHIVFIYIGSHDDCCRWIDRNRGLTHETKDRTYAMRIRCTSQNDNHERKVELEEDEYEKGLMSKIDDKILRQIFSGFAETK
jgi:hypothetical protein